MLPGLQLLDAPRPFLWIWCLCRRFCPSLTHTYGALTVSIRSVFYRRRHIAWWGELKPPSFRPLNHQKDKNHMRQGKWMQEALGLVFSMV